MSGIASLYNVPSNDEELTTWAFAHAAHHADINRVLSRIDSLDTKIDRILQGMSK